MTTGEGIEVRGGAELDRTLGKLAKDLTDLTDVNTKAAKALLASADPPRDSGALAASGSATADREGGTVGYDEIYAGVIHNGWPDHNIDAQPWLSEAATEHQTDLVDIYIDHIEDLVGQVHGI